MIKTDDGIFYMTGGQSCYIAGLDDDRLRGVCFGKRVEPEDDVSALSGADVTQRECAIAVMRAGKKVRTDFVFESSTVGQKQAIPDFPILRGEKTLVVTLVDIGAGLKLELFYAPYARGGIARRAVVTNTGRTRAELVSVEWAGTTLVGEYYALRETAGKNDRAPKSRKKPAKTKNHYGRSDSGFLTVVAADTDERHGEAFGFCPVYGGSFDAAVENVGAKTRVSFKLDFGTEPYTLEPGESFFAPEILSVYSDCGVGGLTRAVHDIVREELISEKFFSRRSPIVLYDPSLDDADVATGKKLYACAAAASGLGADTFLISLGGGDPDDKKLAATIKKVKAACDESGVKLGVWAEFERAEFLPPELLSAAGGERGIVDLTNPAARACLYGKVKTLAELGVEHIKWEPVCAELGDCACYKRLRGLYSLLGEITRDFPDLILEGGFSGVCDYGSLPYIPTVGSHMLDPRRSVAVKYDTAAAFPLCVLGGYVLPDPNDKTTSFKTRFDLATLGGLSYMTDPSALGNAIRAVRAQIFSYQDDARLIASCDLYRLSDPTDGGDFCMMAVSKDKSKAYAVFVPSISSRSVKRVKLYGLDEHNIYYIRELDKTYSGAALIGYGIAVSESSDDGSTTFHLSQVADYE